MLQKSKGPRITTIQRLMGVDEAAFVTTQVVAPDGVSLALHDQGTGPAILVLHGGSGNWQAWQLVMRELRSRYRVFSFDRRPYRHADAAIDRSMRAEVEDAVITARHIGVPLILVGHSSGAVVALEAALAAPGTFAGVFVYEPPVSVDSLLGGQALARARAALDAGHPGRAMQIFLRDIVQVPGYVAWLTGLTTPLSAESRFMAAGQIIDTENIDSLGVGITRYASIQGPVLLLGGAQSPRHLGERLQALSKVLPNVDSVIIMPRQGHAASMFAPRELAQFVASFADRVLGSGAVPGESDA